MGNLSWLSYLGITSAYMGYAECAQDSKLPEVDDYPTYRACSSSCRCQWGKKSLQCPLGNQLDAWSHCKVFKSLLWLAHWQGKM